MGVEFLNLILNPHEFKVLQISHKKQDGTNDKQPGSKTEVNKM